MKKVAEHMVTKTLPWLLVMLVWVPPALGRDPANPEAGVPPARYSPVISGTKSYRPVEPLPWGDVNRRVMPKEAQPDQGKATPKAKDEKRGPHGQN
jgi:hypothetical protein